MILKSKLYGDYIDYDGLCNFIMEVWNYYNGRINVIIPARLDINWVCTYPTATDQIYADTAFNKVVTLYPNIIIDDNYGNINIIHQEIIDTIIHELYHVDQNIEYYKCFKNTRGDYVNYIEYQVEFQTTSYILSNVQDIYNNLKVTIDRQFYEDIMTAMINVNIYGYYVRTTIPEYMINSLGVMLFDDTFVKVSNILRDRFYNTNKDISYFINNTEIVVRQNCNLIPIDSFTIALQFLYGFDFRKIVEYDEIPIEETDNKISIMIFYEDASNRFCRINNTLEERL